MYPRRLPNMPAASAGYMQYLYQKGLYPLHARSHRAAQTPPAVHDPLSNDFSAEWAPIRHLERIQTVEQVIQQGYFAVPKADPVARTLRVRP